MAHACCLASIHPVVPKSSGEPLAIFIIASLRFGNNGPMVYI